MLTPESITTYHRTCNASAGYCAACTKPLNGETYFCDECASDAYVECDPNHRMEESDDN